MSRANFMENEVRQLSDLIPSYYQNKSELDSYKKIVDNENELIKSQMQELSTKNYTVNGLTAKISTQRRESFNEEKLLNVLKSINIDGIVKTKEYVDMDALEDAIYSNKIPKDDLLRLNACKDVKEVQILKVTKEKENK